MELILIPNCTELYLHSNNTKSFEEKINIPGKKVIAINKNTVALNNMEHKLCQGSIG